MRWKKPSDSWSSLLSLNTGHGTCSIEVFQDTTDKFQSIPNVIILGFLRKKEKKDLFFFDYCCQQWICRCMIKRWSYFQRKEFAGAVNFIFFHNFLIRKLSLVFLKNFEKWLLIRSYFSRTFKSPTNFKRSKLIVHKKPKLSNTNYPNSEDHEFNFSPRLFLCRRISVIIKAKCFWISHTIFLGRMTKTNSQWWIIASSCLHILFPTHPLCSFYQNCKKMPDMLYFLFLGDRDNVI